MTTDVHTAWDDLETLVFERDDVLAALEAARSVLDDDTVVVVAPPSLIALDEDEIWLASLPASARAVLDRARARVASWPRAPRIGAAVAVPAIQ